ncbi:hypothetical protein HMPREF0183_1101 [Brevibacterium mcbrellneri ATCC 49030]|uniref:Uncharacterized protein n=1 Tax=Brevibacterium mcbrellneri ATCC 49030 TaxID=585530 RepID=D4YME1_9MICO|nr:hypothetical protein HMPREF0183_1101 [Brevibacterium mcbrellneri ATCC 49030]
MLRTGLLLGTLTSNDRNKAQETLNFRPRNTAATTSASPRSSHTHPYKRRAHAT